MSRGPDPTQPTRLVVWGRAAGRCQYTNCGDELAGDLITGDLAKNHAYLAHIIASNPDGPRGHPVLSHEKSDDPDNLMLLCDRHHREVDDRNKLDIYTVEVLMEMKRRHEKRIDWALKDPDAPSAHILRMSASIGDNETSIPRQACARAMIPQFVIADRHPIDISIRGFEHKDSDPDYYDTELSNLRRVYDREIRGRFRDRDLEIADAVSIVTEKHLDPIEVHNAELLHSVRLPDPEPDAAVSRVVAGLTGAAKITDIVATAGCEGAGFQSVVRMIRRHELELASQGYIEPRSLVRRRIV